MSFERLCSNLTDVLTGGAIVLSTLVLAPSCSKDDGMGNLTPEQKKLFTAGQELCDDGFVKQETWDALWQAAGGDNATIESLANAAAANPEKYMDTFGSLLVRVPSSAEKFANSTDKEIQDKIAKYFDSEEYRV